MYASTQKVLGDRCNKFRCHILIKSLFELVYLFTCVRHLQVLENTSSVLLEYVFIASLLPLFMLNWAKHSLDAFLC